MSRAMTQDELDGALMAAAQYGTFQQVKDLLEKGARLDARDRQGNFPLHLAACHSDEKIAERLLALGASHDVRCNAGMTPLHAAAWNDRGEVVKLLLAAGADPTARNHTGRFPRAFCSETEIRDVLQKAEGEWKEPEERAREALAVHLARQRKLGALRPKGPSL